MTPFQSYSQHCKALGFVYDGAYNKYASHNKDDRCIALIDCALEQDDNIETIIVHTNVGNFSNWKTTEFTLSQFLQFPSIETIHNG